MHYQVPHNTLDMKNVGANSRGSGVYASRISCQGKQRRAVFHTHGDKHRRIELRAQVMEYGRHRVVQPGLLLPLETFRDSKHLTSIMYDIAKGEFIRPVGPPIGVYLVYSPRTHTQHRDPSPQCQHTRHYDQQRGRWSIGRLRFGAMHKRRGCARQSIRTVSLWLSSLSVEPAADDNIPGHMAVYPDRAIPQPK